MVEIFHNLQNWIVWKHWAHIPAQQQLGGAEFQLPPSDALQTFQRITVLNYLLFPSVPPAQPILRVFSGI